MNLTFFENLIMEPYACPIILFDKAKVAATITKTLSC